MSGDRLADISARKVVGGRTLLTEEERDALVEIAKAARVAMASVDDTDFENAVISLRLAFARLDSGAAEEGT